MQECHDIGLYNHTPMICVTKEVHRNYSPGEYMMCYATTTLSTLSFACGVAVVMWPHSPLFYNHCGRKLKLELAVRDHGGLGIMFQR